MARRVRIRREGRRPCDTERQSLMTSSLSAVLQALELGHLDLMGDQRSMEAPPPAEALEQTVSAIWSDLFALFPFPALERDIEDLGWGFVNIFHRAAAPRSEARRWGQEGGSKCI